MKKLIQTITPCLWFDGQAEQAANHYVGIFKRSKITEISRFSKVGHDVHGQKAGSVMTVAFELSGQTFTALNGGPNFKFNEAISFQVNCGTQAEIDYYWSRLTRGGNQRSQVCGWLKDKFGVSWQIVPRILPKMLANQKTASGQRVMAALLGMKKLNIAEMKRAAAG